MAFEVVVEYLNHLGVVAHVAVSVADNPRRPAGCAGVALRLPDTAAESVPLYPGHHLMQLTPLMPGGSAG